MVEWDTPELTIQDQAALLGLNRTGLYYRPAGPSDDEIRLKHRIDELYTAAPFYGSRRITAQLRREGLLVNRKAVMRHMHEMGLTAIAPKRSLSTPHPHHLVYPYLLRTFTLTQPRQVYGIDITYIRLQHGWMYLVAILDWFSRYIVSWELDQTLDLGFVLVAVERALLQAPPQILNSDQGSHFTSPRYLQLLQGAGVQVSMDGKGRALDNIFTERLWRTIKYECIYIHDLETPKETRQVLTTYLDFYNQQRVHQALDYRTPAEVHFGVVHKR